AHVYTSGPKIDDREKMMEQVLKDTGATFIHPYNNYNIIAGQATAAKELLEIVNDLEIVMAPIGGGGLMSGTALWCNYFNPSITVIGSEPKLVDDAYRSFLSGKIESNQRIDTIADGLRTKLGDKTLEIIRRHVDDIITVSEKSIIRAMQMIWERMKIIVEPSGAVPLAAILENQDRFRNKKVGIIISGGNVDLKNLPFR
ncbi:MAG: pyridoxal-phosphate dependent enzyme, partial [Saprospiraceae bacterium]|nr:pyridoxal-phosphate dependent enzyme [Saprospiraceae bacterium]